MRKRKLRDSLVKILQNSQVGLLESYYHKNSKMFVIVCELLLISIAEGKVSVSFNVDLEPNMAAEIIIPLYEEVKKIDFSLDIIDEYIYSKIHESFLFGKEAWNYWREDLRQSFVTDEENQKFYDKMMDAEPLGYC